MHGTAVAHDVSTPKVSSVHFETLPHSSGSRKNESFFADRFFRFASDRIPVVLIGTLSLLDFAVYFYASSPWIALLWVFALMPIKACVCSWNHHHQHVATFHQKYLNRFLEVLYALHTGISTNGWVLHHNLGHHLNYLDQTRDESAWKDKNGRRMGALRYTLTVALTGYWRAYQVGRRHPKFQREFCACGVLVMLLVGVLLYFNWVNAMLVFVLPMAAGLALTAWHTFYHHSGLETDNHFEASHNVMNRWYNIFTGNLGYHTAHHVKPGLHWSKLPEFHKTIEHKIPKHLYGKAVRPLCWLPD